MFVQMEKRNFMHGLGTLPTLKTTAICSAKAKQTSSKLRALFLSFKISFDTNAMSIYPTKHFLKNCRTVGAIANLLFSNVTCVQEKEGHKGRIWGEGGWDRRGFAPPPPNEMNSAF